MDIRQINYFSHHLNKGLDVRIYGDSGFPVLVFPDQDGMAFNYEFFGMVEAIRDRIENGDIQLFTVDGVDKESWSDSDIDPAYRAWRQEEFYQFITDELVNYIHEVNHSVQRIGLTGCSLGASQAALFFLRRPDLFEGCIALSGIYDATFFIHGFMNPTLYDNSPLHFLPNMDKSHPYIPLYNDRCVIFCAGQGPYEKESLDSLKKMQEIFNQKGISAWFDVWGGDVAHHWYWWQKEIAYFLPFMISSFRKHYG